MNYITTALLSILIAMPAYAQKTPEALGKLWVDAIRTNDASKIKPLIHPGCPRNSIRYGVLNRMVSGKLPPDYMINTTDMGPRDLLEKQFYVMPEIQLVVYYNTKTPEEKKRYGLGKGFPIAKEDGRWYFVLCMKPRTESRTKK